MIVDLHSHSTASDGSLEPLALLQRASEQGVDMMAITDHDTISGYLQVKQQWKDPSMQLVAGVELSCVWSGRLIHVVGLNMDVESGQLLEGLQQQQQSREQRAHLIGQKLDKYGFKGGYEFAAELAGDSQIGRPHFARFLVEGGHVRSEEEAFKRYLGAGKPGDIKLTWPQLTKVVQWIVESGGEAVLAHPLHYKMTATKLKALVADFKSAGGSALEVISGKQAVDRTQFLTQIALQFELLGSVGSDFHRPGMPWRELGQVGCLPKACPPVWSTFVEGVL